MSDHPILFIPGPVEVDDELRQIMAMPLCGHRSAAFKEAVVAVCGGLRDLFVTRAHAFFENAPATALMEAGIRNLVTPGGAVLHVSCGAFGERWAKISAACGRRPHHVARPWGQPVTADDVTEALAAAGNVEAVCLTHNETSTGAIVPLAELAAACREAAPDALILVDAVTSLAGAELRFDELGIDLAFAGTQKCLALPPGLCVFALSGRAVERAGAVPDRGFLLDFAAEPARFEAGETPATPCVPLVFALRRQLERIAVEGLERRWSRHGALRDRTLEWAAEHGFEPLIAEPWRSPTVTTLLRGQRDLDQLVLRAKAAGFTIGKGYGKLKGESFRIGHMGDHSLERLDALLAALVA